MHSPPFDSSLALFTTRPFRLGALPLLSGMFSTLNMMIVAASDHKFVLIE